MADIDITTITYTKGEIDTKITNEENRVDGLLDLKIDSSDKGAVDGIAPLSSGVLPSANVDWASNAEALAGTDATKVMSPLRVKEAHDSFMANAGGVTQTSTSVSQANTLNIAASKMTYFDTNCVDVGSHFTVNAINQEITINTAGTYRISGMMTVEAALSADLTIAPYKNGASVWPDMTITGLGAGNPTSWHYNIVCTLAANDVITIWGSADADSTAVSVTSSAFGMEKMIHG